MENNERLHALDSLRAVAMLLGIVLHAAIPYMAFRTFWIVHDANPNAGFDSLVGLIHGFRMQLFYVIAGFFAHLVWKKSGTRIFIRQRGLRIGVPFVAGLLTIVPLGLWLYFWSESINGPNPDLPKDPQPSLLLYPTMHLWFLEVLLMLYAAAMILALLRHRPAGISLAQTLDRAFDWLICHPAKPLILTVPAVALIWNGPSVGEVEAMGVQLFPSLRALIYFAMFFGFGWWLHRRVHHLGELRRYLKSYLLLALIGYFAWGAGFSGMSPDDPDWPWVKLIANTGASLYAWSMTFALTGLFLRYASAHRPWARYLADASYWFYLWHMPIVLWLQVWLNGVAMNPWLKLIVILCATVTMLLPSYHWLVRYTWIGRILNGERQRPLSVGTAA